VITPATRFFHDLAGRDVEDGRMVSSEDQLQILGDELDVDETARNELQVPDVRVTFFPGDEPTHGARRMSDCGGAALARRLPHRFGQRGPKARIAGDETGAGKRHMLPALCFVLLVEF
jgi:transposase